MANRSNQTNSKKHGQIVETASAEALFESPGHPYSRTLLAAVPRIEGTEGRARAPEAGAVHEVPSPLAPPSGCRFHPRCPDVLDRCSRDVPADYPTATGRARCFLRA